MQATRSRRLLWAGLAVPVVVVAAVLAGNSAGAAAAGFAAVFVTLAFVVAARLDGEERVLVARVANAAILAIPGALVVTFAFNGGGFFPETPALAALALALILLVRTLGATDPFEGFGAPLAIAAGALALYCVWALVSFAWSHAPGRAFVESDRALLYLLVLVLFGSIGRTRERLSWMARGLVAGIAAVCVCALITRLLPHVWPITPNIVNNRLSFPVTYWNSLGLIAAIAAVLALHLTSSLDQPPAVRIAAAALLPVLATTLLFTYSRGAIAAGVIGIVAYALLGRPRGLLSALLSAGPATAIALIAAYGADRLATTNTTTPAAVVQGRHVAIVLAACIAGAAALRALELPLDRRLARFEPSARARGLARLGLAGSAVALVIALLAAGAPHWVHGEYHRFLSKLPPEGTGTDTRSRLTDPSNNGRLANWTVALNEYRGSKLHGDGAGTYALAWATHRPASFGPFQVVNAHSLYIENLSDLGLVGFALIVTALGTILATMAVRIRGPGRAIHAALFAVTLAWALEAGIDWQWQMPVVTAAVFALSGAALARPAPDHPAERRSAWAPRAAMVAGCLAVGAVALLVGLSQSHIDDSVAAIKQQNCPAADSSAHAAIGVLALRPEPYQVLGYCAIQDGHPATAVADMRKAVKRDPHNWQYRYGLAVARAAAGQDPHPDLLAASRLGPYQVLPDDASALFDSKDPRVWRRRAPLAPLPDELTS